MFSFLCGEIVEKIDFLLIELNKHPKRISIDNTLKTKQQLVGLIF